MDEKNSTVNPSKTRLDNLVGLGGIILVALALRPSLVSIGPVLPQVTQSFKLSHTSAGLLTTIPDVLMGLLALPTPWLAHKYGRDKLIIIAMILLTLSTFARAFSTNTTVLLLTTAGVGAGIAITGALLSGFIKVSFLKRTTLVMGIYASSLALGSTISAFLTIPIADAFGGWRLAIGSYAIIGLIGTIAWKFLSIHKNKNADYKSLPQLPHVSLPWGNSKAWLVAIFFACVNFLFYALLAWMVAFFQESGLPAKKAGGLLAVLTLSFMIATPIISAMSRSTDRRFFLGTSAFITLVGLITILNFPSWFPFGTVSLIGIGLAGTFTLGMTLPLDNTHHAAATNSWTAFMLTIGYLLAGLGPLLVGVLRDHTGNFTASLYLLSAVSVLMFVLAFLLKPIVNKPTSPLKQEQP